MKRWNIVITGYGAIGKQVAELLERRKERYIKLYQCDVRLVAVCGSRVGLYDSEGLAFTRISEKANLQAGLTGVKFLESIRPDVLIEAGPSEYETGGSGYAYIKAALDQGTHVIAISKGALVFDYAGLRERSLRNNAALKISGATSSALPTIDLLQYNLAGCEISEVEGIFTATTNLILSRMMEGHSFKSALLEAQEQGMAEPDPRSDIEGWDTACKIVILANAAFHAGISLNDVPRDSIEHISPEQIRNWRSARRVPKLVGRIVRDHDSWTASVRLESFLEAHPFARVNGQAKAIRVSTDTMGQILVIGESKPLATAAAALKDLEHILQRALLH